MDFNIRSPRSRCIESGTGSNHRWIVNDWESIGPEDDSSSLVADFQIRLNVRVLFGPIELFWPD